MDTKSKGNRTVAKAKKYLNDRGYSVDTVEKTGKFQKQKDMFGLFDLVAIKYNHVIFIQVKTNSTSGCLKHIHDFSKNHKIEGLHYWIMVWYDRQDWVIHKFHKEKKIKIDRRKITIPILVDKPKDKCSICGKIIVPNRQSKINNRCISCNGGY